MEKLIGIYKITNIINGKVYIGSTKVSFKSRFDHHYSRLKNGKHYNKHLQLSTIKYGLSNFKFEILEECNVDECLILEKVWINFYNSTNFNFGYNKSDDPTNFRKGCVNSEETKNKIREARKNQENVGQIKVVRISLTDGSETEYNSINEASVDNNNCGSSNICKCIKGIYRTCAKYKWKYKDPDSKRKLSVINKLPIINETENNHGSIAIYCLDQNNNRIDFKSISEAKRFLKIGNSRNIDNCLKGKRKNAYNYKWFYKELKK